MTLSEAIIKRINNLMNIKNIENPHQLALRCGLDESVIRSVLSGRTKQAYDNKVKKGFNIDNVDEN